jgi:hypothetical protein
MAFTTSRHVHRLSLKATSDEIAQRLAIVITDALHTATIPAANQGRIVIIRKLALGRIASDSSSNSIALRVEQRVRYLITSAVSANSPSAALADAVSFRDFSEAVILCSRRIIARQNLDEWFWSNLFPSLNSGKSPGELLCLLIDSIHARPEPLQTVAAVMREAIRACTVSEVFPFITETKVRQWLWSEGLNPFVDDLQQKSDSPDVHIKLISMVITHLNKWGITDVRSFWLAAVLIAIENPSFIVERDFSSHVKILLDKLDEHAPDIRDKNSLPILNLTSDPSRPCSFETEANVYKDNQMYGVRRMAESDSCNDTERMTLTNYTNDYRHHKYISENHKKESCISDTSLIISDESTNDETNEKKRCSPTGEWTNYAGLFFLIPILDRLGIKEFIEHNKALANVRFGEKMLLSASRRFGMKEDDPLTAALNDSCDLMALDSVFELPAMMMSFLERSGNIVNIQSVLKLWMTAVRHFCRRKIHMGLLNIVKRNGFVFISKKHIDICFNLDQADIRLRRNALDVDPGWVPWMDRVIRFHYGDTENGC